MHTRAGEIRFARERHVIAIDDETATVKKNKCRPSRLYRKTIKKENTGRKAQSDRSVVDSKKE